MPSLFLLSNMQTPPRSPGSTRRKEPSKAQVLFNPEDPDLSDESSESDQIYPLNRDLSQSASKLRNLPDVQKMHIPNLNMPSMHRSWSTESLSGDNSFLPLETPTDYDLNELFERTEVETEIEYSQVQVVEEAHVVDHETRDACKEIEDFLAIRDRFVYRKPVRYWGALDAAQMRKYNKGPLGRWRHEPKVRSPHRCDLHYLFCADDTNLICFGTCLVRAFRTTYSRRMQVQFSC